MVTSYIYSMTITSTIIVKVVLMQPSFYFYWSIYIPEYTLLVFSFGVVCGLCHMTLFNQSNVMSTQYSFYKHLSLLVWHLQRVSAFF